MAKKKPEPQTAMTLSDLQWAVLAIIGRDDRTLASGLHAKVKAAHCRADTWQPPRRSVLDQIVDELVAWDFVQSFPASYIGLGRSRCLRLTILGREAVANPAADIQL